ncbi:MAG: pyridoxal phosphate-dependent aminotransferase [Lachnospiraceae bacterium]
MKQYEHGGNIYSYKKEILDFSANINPLGMPPNVKKALVKNIKAYEIYPDYKNMELKEAICQYHKIPVEHIACANGAANLIYRIVYALRPKNAILVAPTFSEYEKALKEVSCSCHHYLLGEEFAITTDILNKIDQRYDMMFLCNPNNPTGIPCEKELVLEIAKKCKEKKIILIVDECFVNFLLEEEKYSIVNDLLQLEHVVIVKAFTKMYAMAGIRLGYALCGNTLLCKKFEKVLEPWSVSTVASKCGIAAMKEKKFVEKTKTYIEKERILLIESLKKLGFFVYPSKANYIFFRGKKNLVSDLMEYEILIRSCNNYIGLDDTFYRIAVRKREENKKLIDALKKITNKDASVES